jgi:polyhydroxybutyrate depolymerase
MNLRWLILALPLLASCSPAAQQGRAPGHYVETLKQGAENRNYILRIPKNYVPGTPTPVVFALHGLSGNMDYFAASTKIEDVADRECFICVIPNGVPTNFRGWNTGFFAMAGSKDDVGFITTILDNVEKEFTTDKKRTFIFGHSNGAMMSYYLGGLMSDRFAAVAGIAGTVGIPKASSAIKFVPAPKVPISVLMIHGQKDKMVAYKPGDQAMLQCMGAEDGAKWWAKQCSCAEKPEVTELVKGLATLTSYTMGKDGTEVRLISTVNGTHDVPGANSGNGTETASGVDAISEIWKFFKSHPRK